MTQGEIVYDVVVVGAGNAAMCAALSAQDQGATVVILEKAPPAAQGGNCPYTGGGLRFVHEGIDDIRQYLPDLTDSQVANVDMGPYTSDDFREHLTAVTHGDTDPDLMEVIVAQSRPTIHWMHSKGVVWELPSAVNAIRNAPSLIPSGVGLSAWQSGAGLIQMLTTACRRNGIDILYETKMLKLLQNERGQVNGVLARDRDGVHEIRSGGVVLACGGFEANAEMRGRYLGPGWDRAKVRGAKYNTGDGHKASMEIGAKPGGHWAGCHCTPIEVNAPSTGILEMTDKMPRRSYPIGIMVNTAGRRFVDEGEGYAEQSFVKVTHKILAQERHMAYQIFDNKAIPLLEPRYSVSSEPITADTIEDLAKLLGMNPDSLEATVNNFNAEAHQAEYNPRQLDGLATRHIDPPKSNWAIKIETPPFIAYAVTGGITYTFGGPQINAEAQVLDTEDIPIPGLFAAGEIVGGILFHNSLRGGGLMHGAVFGKIAGANAARGAAVQSI